LKYARHDFVFNLNESLRLTPNFVHRFLDDPKHSERKSDQQTGSHSISIVFVAVSIYEVTDRCKAQGGTGQFHSESGELHPGVALRFHLRRLLGVCLGFAVGIRIVHAAADFKMGIEMVRRPTL
jgi:hypothetical protein